MLSLREDCPSCWFEFEPSVERIEHELLIIEDQEIAYFRIKEIGKAEKSLLACLSSSAARKGLDP